MFGLSQASSKKKEEVLPRDEQPHLRPPSGAGRNFTDASRVKGPHERSMTGDGGC